MELKPNMYVRLNCNYELGIGKTIREIDEDNFIKTKFKDDFECSVPMYMILKASHNIIDLIEVGDVIKFDITDTDNYVDIQGYNCWEISCEEELNGVKEMIEMKSAKLISIVTREQFKSMEYRLGDK